MKFVGLGGGAAKKTAALRTSAGDGASLNRTVDKANEGAHEKMEEMGGDVIWEDKDRTAWKEMTC